MIFFNTNSILNSSCNIYYVMELIMDTFFNFYFTLNLHNEITPLYAKLYKKKPVAKSELFHSLKFYSRLNVQNLAFDITSWRM